MKESEIRPQALVDKYIELSEKDAGFLFGRATFSKTECVACGGISLSSEIEKFRFFYDRCNDCDTLFLNPRPSLASFEQLYANSQSSRYWAEVFFPAVAESRRNAVFIPRVEDLKTKFNGALSAGLVAIDVGAGYGIFLEELKKLFPSTNCIAIEPSETLSQVCLSKGIHTEIAMVESIEHLAGTGELVSCFEVLEHVQSPLDFMVSLRNLTRPGGHVYLTTLTSDGFDLQALGSHSFQVSPPHHINFLSIKGIRALFDRAGLEVVEIETPGALDLEIVLKSESFREYKGLFKKFFEKIEQDSNIADAFQSFLREHLLSSHIRVIARRPL